MYLYNNDHDNKENSMPMDSDTYQLNKAQLLNDLQNI